MVKILLVDDEPLILASLSRILQGEDWQIDCARDAAAAEEALRLGTYDLVISDQHMPGKKGTEFLRDLRAKSSTIRLVLMTGMPTAITPCSTEGLELSAVVAKPWDRSDLISTLHKVLDTPVGGEAFEQTQALSG